MKAPMKMAHTNVVKKTAFDVGRDTHDFPLRYQSPTASSLDDAHDSCTQGDLDLLYSSIKER